MVAETLPKSGTARQTLQALETLVWRYGHESSAAASAPALPTGFAELDRALPQHGWFGSGLNELLGNEQGIGEFSLLLPALRQVSAAGKAVLLVNPPFLPYAPALEQAGITFAHLIIVRQADTQHLYWAAEQALRSKACGAVVAWSDESARLLPDLMLRRLHVAAQSGACAGFLFRPRRAREQPSPAPLRVVYAAQEGALELTLFRCRGLSGMPRVRVQPWRHAWAARRLPVIAPQRLPLSGAAARPAQASPVPSAMPSAMPSILSSPVSASSRSPTRSATSSPCAPSPSRPDLEPAVPHRWNLLAPAAQSSRQAMAALHPDPAPARVAAHLAAHSSDSHPE